MLELKNVSAGYGDTQVLFDVSMRVAQGEAVALLGRNGMGKTTTLLAIMGINPATSGSIVLRGADVTRMPPFRIARMGIGYSPEGRRLFPTLTVLQNLRIPFVNKAADKSLWKEKVAGVYELFPRLRERESQLAGSLSGGEQQMVAIARTIIADDPLLLLDEPTEGIAPTVVHQIITAISALKAQGRTVLIVEQNPFTAFEVADRAYVLEKGRVVLSESTARLAASPDVMERYMGISAEVQA